MMEFDRRAFLGAGGTLAAAVFLSACAQQSPGTGTAAAAAGADLRWWDHYSALQKYHASWAAEESKRLGVKITHTYNDATKSAQALQLANQSKQLPDIYSNTLGLPISALVKEKWVSEIMIPKESLDRLPKGSFTEGVTNLEGKLYGLPLFSFRQYSTATWFNKDIIAKAGIDGDNPPATYDEFLEACKKVKGLNGGFAAMTLALGDPNRMRDQMDDMAQAGGFPGYQGLRFATGEYGYHDDAYVNAIEFWKELNDSGYILPGSSNFTVANARTRWASGAAAFFPDGPWCAGGVRNVAEGFVPLLNNGPLLKAEQNSKVTVYRGAPAPQFFVAGNSKNPEAAGKLLESFTTAEYQKGLAAGMDQPPIDLDVVDSADVIESYKKVVSYFKSTVYRAPQAVVRNPQIAVAQSLAKPISPLLGDIIQGYLGGDITDLKGALKKLSDSFSADREQAIKGAVAKGAQVSADDYAFPDWKPGMDYVYQ